MPTSGQEQGPRLRVHRHDPVEGRTRTCSAIPAACRSRQTRARSPTRSARPPPPTSTPSSNAERSRLLPGLAGAGLLRPAGQGPQTLIGGSQHADRIQRRHRQALPGLRVPARLDPDPGSAVPPAAAHPDPREERTSLHGDRLLRPAPEAAGGQDGPRRLRVVYLLPGLIGFVLVIVRAVRGQHRAELHQVDRGRNAPVRSACDNYTRLLQDSEFWASFLQQHRCMIVAMAVIPTALGLLLAAVLFDYVGRALRAPAGRASSAPASTCRRSCRSPWPASLWGWILQPDAASLNSVLEAIGLGQPRRRTGSATRPGAAVGDGGDGLVPARLLPVVMFMAGLQRIDPSLYEAADLDGASWLQRLPRDHRPDARPEIYVVLLTTTIAALKVFAPIFVLTSGRPRQRDDRALVLRLQELLRQAPGRLRRRDRRRCMTVLIIVLAVVFLRCRSAAERGRSPA